MSQFTNMAIMTPQPATLTASVSDAHEQPKPLGISSQHACRRIYRCCRCSQRKFRTSRDLATHILAKHSHIHLIPTKTSITRVQTQTTSSALADDTKSVTFTSPLIAAADMGEIDCLLVSVSKSRGNSSKVQNMHPSVGVRHSCAQRTRINADTLTHTISSSRSFADVCTKNVHTKQRLKPTRPTQDREPDKKNECTGPSSHEVFIRRCRKGLIPLVPIQSSQPSEKLNFAQGLF